MTCEVERLGLVPYQQAGDYQRKLAREIAAGERSPALLLLEHPHTYTFGRSGHAENLVWSEQELAVRGVEVHWVDRGGDVTYHGPGQLVGYPLIPLGRLNSQGRLPQADYIVYVRRLEEVLIQALAQFGLVVGQIPGLTGVWVQPDVASRCPRCPPAARLAPSKIAAIGVKVDARGVSQHGFALNVNPDMSYWEGIIGCGLAGHASISMADLLDEGSPPEMEAVMDEVAEQFGRVFGYQMKDAAAVRV